MWAALLGGLTMADGATPASLDEDDVRVRADPRGTRPRTKQRPGARATPQTGMVVTVDRGRFTRARRTASTVTAMRARELGRKGIVVGDRVGVVGDLSGGAGRARPHRAGRRARRPCCAAPPTTTTRSSG